MATPRVAHVARTGRRFATQANHPYAGIAALGNIKAKGEVHSFADAKAFLNGETEKTIASNVTIIVRDADDQGNPTKIAVRLYQTDIITYYSDETFSWTNGGYYTPTTSNRANQFGPKGYWFSSVKCQLHANSTSEAEGLRLPVFRVRPQ